MTIQDDIRNDLDEEVFGQIGKSVTLISKSAPIYNTRGEQESITNTETAITIVPYNITQDKRSYEENGNLDEGDMFAAVRYDQVIEVDDQLLIESEYWTVKDKEVNYLPDNVVTIIRMAKDQN